MKNSTNSYEKKIPVWVIILFVVFFYLLINSILDKSNDYNGDGYSYSDRVFSLITTPENKPLESVIKKYADDNDFDVTIIYADNIEIVEKINAGEKYDAIWASNSIWLDMIDSSVKVSNFKSTSITPIVFGIKKSVAERLGLVDKDVTMNDLLTLIKAGELNFSMANPIMTNSGASAYFNILSTLAGNPEVLTLNHLQNETLRKNLIDFFKGLSRTSGDENFLEESFINGDYDAAVTYESSIININKKLESQNKEILYVVYPRDGVSISDSPIVFINNGNDVKKEQFLGLQSYIMSSDGQKELASLGRRTWYGGVTDKADKNLFKKEWGIDTTKYISSVKYPSKEVMKEALKLYQEELRKPVYVVFCLDFSGSMYGEGKAQLVDAMDYIFGNEAISSMIQFSKNDLVSVVIFGSEVDPLYGPSSGDKVNDYMSWIINTTPEGTTALFPAVIEALEILQYENSDQYNLSVIVMTDGEGNVGSFSDLKKFYKSINKEIPVYSITFGEANEDQLIDIAELTNGKVFDGREDLTKAFKTVRGYN